jgi:hypothetical protein
MQGSEFRWRIATGLAQLPTDLLPQSLQVLAANIGQHPSVKALTRKARAGRLSQPQNLTSTSATGITHRPPKWVSLLTADTKSL